MYQFWNETTQLAVYIVSPFCVWGAGVFMHAVDQT
jgi:hypothetical protein